MKDHGVPFGEAMKVWARVAALSFGGPAGQIAVMHRIIVEEKKWIGEQRFLQALNYCTLLPGPEAQQLAIYIGWLMHKTKGGLFAGTLFVLPGLLAIMALSWIYVLLGKVTIVQGLFFGLKAAVLVIVIEAVLRVGRRALKNNTMRAVGGGGLSRAVPLRRAVSHRHSGGRPHRLLRRPRRRAGVPGRRRPRQGRRQAIGRRRFAVGRGNARACAAQPPLVAVHHRGVPGALAGAGGGALFRLGGGNVFTKIAIFFSQMAVVTFGGAYAVLAYVAQQAVDNYHWVTAGEMLDGLGMAETTPGPLIMVTQFVGFLAAWREPGAHAAAARRDAGRPAHHLGHLRALLPLDLLRRALRRGVARQQGAGRGTGRDHRRRGRRDPEPRGVVRAARAVRQARAGALAGGRPSTCRS